MGLDQYIYKIKREEKKYYRKFNALHNYMVQKKNGGEEINCKPVTLQKEDFEELKRITGECLDVIMPEKWRKKEWDIDFDEYQEGYDYLTLSDGKGTETSTKVTNAFKNKVAELFPPVGGFFFGSTDVDGFFVLSLYDLYEDVCDILKDYEPGDEYAYDAWW